MLMDPMVMSVLYVYCMINQDQIVSFWFGTRFKARYLPWALFGMNFLLSGGGMSELAGILVGHLYYFVMMKYPAEQGVTLIRTPQFLYNYLPSTHATTYVPPSRPAPGVSPTPSAPAAPTGYNWGRGRRLEDWCNYWQREYKEKDRLVNKRNLKKTLSTCSKQVLMSQDQSKLKWIASDLIIVWLVSIAWKFYQRPPKFFMNERKLRRSWNSNKSRVQEQ